MYYSLFPVRPNFFRCFFVLLMLLLMSLYSKEMYPKTVRILLFHQYLLITTLRQFTGVSLNILDTLPKGVIHCIKQSTHMVEQGELHRWSIQSYWSDFLTIQWYWSNIDELQTNWLDHTATRIYRNISTGTLEIHLEETTQSHRRARNWLDKVLNDIHNIPCYLHQCTCTLDDNLDCNHVHEVMINPWGTDNPLSHCTLNNRVNHSMIPCNYSVRHPKFNVHSSTSLNIFTSLHWYNHTKLCFKRTLVMKSLWKPWAFSYHKIQHAKFTSKTHKLYWHEYWHNDWMIYIHVSNLYTCIKYKSTTENIKSKIHVQLIWVKQQKPYDRLYSVFTSLSIESHKQETEMPPAVTLSNKGKTSRPCSTSTQGHKN